VRCSQDVTNLIMGPVSYGKWAPLKTLGHMGKGIKGVHPERAGETQLLKKKINIKVGERGQSKLSLTGILN